MKNLKKFEVNKEQQKSIKGGRPPGCCSYYPLELASCCATPSSMSCPPPWEVGTFPGCDY